MYVKLFGSILDSSVWDEDHATRLVWITMLTMADQDGVVRAADSGIAHRARVSPAECAKAFKVLSEPDIESKSQEYGGRRIERIEGGWLVLNYRKYREIRTEQQVRDALRQQRHRQKDRPPRDTSRDTPPVTTEAEADTEAGSKALLPAGETEISEKGPASVEHGSTVTRTNGSRPRKYEDIKTHLAVVLAEVEEGRVRRLKADEVRTLQAELVFSYWQAECGHERALLDDQRLNQLKRFLKENGGNVHELLWAVKGWSKDPTFQRMADQEGRVLDGINNIFRNRERLERLANQCKGYREGKPHPMAVKYLEPLQGKERPA